MQKPVSELKSVVFGGFREIYSYLRVPQKVGKAAAIAETKFSKVARSPGNRVLYCSLQVKQLRSEQSLCAVKEVAEKRSYDVPVAVVAAEEPTAKASRFLRIVSSIIRESIRVVTDLGAVGVPSGAVGW